MPSRRGSCGRSRASASWLRAGGGLRHASALVLDPKADCDGERTDVRLVDRLGQFEPGERVAEPNGDAEQTLELLRQPGELCAAAGEDDLADREAARLRLVVGERRHELADERLDSAIERGDGRGCLL